MKLKNFAMITEDKVFRKLKETPEIFCIADDFCKFFDAQMAKYTFKAERKRKYHRESQLLNFMITPGDVDGRKPLEYKAFVEFVYGKLVGDKGYIGKRLFERLFVDGIQLITKLKNFAMITEERYIFIFNPSKKNQPFSKKLEFG